MERVSEGRAVLRPFKFVEYMGKMGRSWGVGEIGRAGEGIEEQQRGR
jgi:hypothetical protein